MVKVIGIYRWFPKARMCRPNLSFEKWNISLFRKFLLKPIFAVRTILGINWYDCWLIAEFSLGLDWSGQPVLTYGKASWEFWTGLEILEAFIYDESQSLIFAFLHAFRAVIKISGCWGNDTSRQEIQQLGILFGFIFLLFSYKNRRGSHS